MMRFRIVFVLGASVLTSSITLAQNSAGLTAGRVFAESIAPQTSGQIVNPAGVNPAAWAPGTTSMPTTSPPGLGSFSTPITNSQVFSTSGARGALAALGSAKTVDCANYVPTGDPIADQECAAVKFMNKDCISPSNTQSHVVGAAGTPTPPGGNCSNTYGDGQANFTYQDNVNATDSVFHLSQSVQANVSATTPQNCVSIPIITQPALYESRQCNKTITTDEHTCTQALHLDVTLTFSPAEWHWECPEGDREEDTCVVMPHCTPEDIANGVQCSTPYTISATKVYTCPASEFLVEHECKKVHIQKWWTDDCDPYEISSGVPLGVPID